MKVTIEYPAHIRDRLLTLKMFKATMVQYGRSRGSRASAYRAYKDVLSQLNDKKLMEMRRRLLLAVKARDERVEWKISNQIKAYLGQQLFTNPNWQH